MTRAILYADVDPDTRPIPLWAIFRRDAERVRDPEIRANLSRDSGYRADRDGRILEGEHVVPICRHYAGRHFVVLHLHDAEAQYCADAAFGNVTMPGPRGIVTAG